MFISKKLNEKVLVEKAVSRYLIQEFVCCDQCTEVFKNMRSLETHKRVHSENFKHDHKVVCDHCGKELYSQSLRTHLETFHSATTTRNIENVSRIYQICVTKIAFMLILNTITCLSQGKNTIKDKL